MKSAFPKTLVFCSNYDNCSQLYMYLLLQSTLGRYFTDPPGYPNLHVFQLIEMYTRACLPHMKEKVLSSFSTAGSKLRLVVATTAFSMGINCADIRRVYHYGPPQVVLNSMCKKHAGLDVMAYCHKPSCCMASLEGLQKRK